MSVTKIPNRDEVMFMIANNEAFVLKMLAALYERHSKSKNIFTAETKKDGVRLGRWLSRHGRFTTGYTPGKDGGEGHNNKSNKSVDDHMQSARGVLFRHVPEIIQVITDKVRAAALKAAPKLPPPLAVSVQRSAEIVAMLDAMSKADANGSIPEDERPTNPITTPYRYATG